MTESLTLFQARVLWAHAVLATELARGQRAGYFDGEPEAELTDPRALRARIEEAAIDDTPMVRVAANLALTAPEVDAVWLLTCCESEPQLGRFVEHLASAGMHQLSVQQLRRMVGVSLRSLERLFSLGLVEIDLDPRIGLDRRKVRASDRITQLLAGDLESDTMLEGIARLMSPLAAIHTTEEVRSAARSDESLLVIASGS